MTEEQPITRKQRAFEVEEVDLESTRQTLPTASAETQTLDGQDSVVSRLSNVSSRHRRKPHKTSNGAEDIVRAEASTVRKLRIALVCLIATATAVCGTLIYKISSKNETDSFRQSFQEVGTKFTKGFLDTQAEILNYAYVISLSISSSLYADSKYIPSFPNVSINHLDILATGLSHRGLVNDLMWSPMLHTEEERTSWEAYALSNLAKVSESTYPPCNVCGEGHDIVYPNALLNFPERQVSCGILAMSLVDGTTSPGQCSYLTQLVVPTCGCQTSVSRNDPNNTVSSEKNIFRLQDGVQVIDQGPPPYSPVWQITPTAGSKQVALFNLMSETWRSEALTNMLELEVPSISTTYDPSQDGVYKLNKGIPSFGPSASVFFPVFKSLESNQVAGSLVLDFSWMQLFDYILPPKSEGVVIVLDNNQGQMFSFQAVETGLVSFLGEGDLHDKRFDSEVVESSYLTYNILRQFSGPKPFDATSPPANYCSYRVRLFPSSNFESQYKTGKPAIYTLIVVLAFGVTTLVFLLYDWLLRCVQSKVLDSAKQSEALVSSFFPAFVRDRVLGNANKPITVTSGFSNLWQGRGANHQLANHKARLQSYLSHPLSYDVLSQTDPIADLYPNTTVMFADISGFTAWSSEREPSQVFKLLESLFYEFDEVARTLGVFKVETIGDCYVAVTGLPEKNKDHAVIMAEFAFQCVVRMRELVSKLESALGPGTADLSIRVGLHSGPVTAGVLRGDRARLQLFGDTMNVASRMENTCEPNRVHISMETANLLKEAGKEHLVTERDEPVSVKGKGEMQTYWATPLPQSNTNENGSRSGNTIVDCERYGRSSFSLDGTESDMWGGTSLDNTLANRSSSSQGRERLVEWFADLLHGLLLKIVASNNQSRNKIAGKDILWNPPLSDETVTQFVDEITEVIEMPGFNERNCVEPKLETSPGIRLQLREYVAEIASLYRENPFHNFHHACHVAMSASKLLKRIIAPDCVDYQTKSRNKKGRTFVSKQIHDSTFGISSDPLMQFAVVFSALVHDVDHTGLTNQQLQRDLDPLATKYQGKCVAEQHSIQVAWDLLMEDRFAELRSCVFRTEKEKQRFRQLLVNGVIATDIADKELGTWRKNRWEKVFHLDPSICDTEAIDDRKATIVFEYIIQASDVAHTMQHWHVYQKWNKRLFDERYGAYLAGRDPTDPSISWHKGELWFFDNYIIPLAKKLEECNVFGVSCDEFLTHALQNRREWEMKGEAIVAELVASQDLMKATNVMETEGKPEHSSSVALRELS